METWAQIKDLDWSLVASSGNVSNWPNRLWPMEKHYHWLGASGGYGVGYGAPASVGAALANRDLGRFSVSIQSDGDLMYAPGVLWTAAKHKIPLLAVMHNNRGYHQEVMHVQRLSNFRNRVASLGGDMGPIGTSIENPDIEYHKLAESMGWWAKGPIKDPDQLGAGDQGSGRGGEVRPARAGQCLDAAALRGEQSMRFVRVSGLAALAAGLVLGCGGALAASAEKGKTAFVQHGCWQCHGFQGQGGVTGPKLAPEPLPLETFTAFVRTSNRAMPPYMEAILSNEDLADIHAYLESIPKPPDPKSIPLLNQ